MGGVIPLFAGAAAAVGVAAWTVRGRSSSVFGPSIWRGSCEGRAVALTFDDGPSESTPRLLDLLDRFNATATFFQVGLNADRLPDIAREVSRRGHEIGNHTYSHAMLPTADVETEVARAQQVLGEVHGGVPRWFRAPYGVRWFGLRDAQRRHGLTGVMWSTIGLDWKASGEEVARRLSDGASPGAILCLHDGRALAARPDISSTIEALERILPTLSGIGYHFQSVSQIACLTNSRNA